jgi:hypothetical protein
MSLRAGRSLLLLLIRFEYCSNYFCVYEILKSRIEPFYRSLFVSMFRLWSRLFGSISLFPALLIACFPSFRCSCFLSKISSTLEYGSSWLLARLVSITNIFSRYELSKLLTSNFSSPFSPIPSSQHVLTL